MVLKKKIRKVVPRPLVQLGNRLLLWWWRRRIPSLAIRPDTTDIIVFRDIFLFKWLDLPARVQPKVIVDVGAYAGFSPLFFNYTYPEATVLGVEAERGNFEQMAKLTENNPRITAVHQALWSEKTTMTITERYTGDWGYTIVPDGTGATATQATKVATTTILDLMQEHNLTTIDILKIDIEGAEKAVFEANPAAWLPQINVIMIELHDRIVPGCKAAFFAAVTEDEWDISAKGDKWIAIRKHFV